MKFLFLISALIHSMALTTPACSIPYTTTDRDTLPDGSVSVVVTQYMHPSMPPANQLTYGPFTMSDLTAHLTSVLNDSGLVFIAHIDSLEFDSTVVLVPQVNLTSVYTNPGSIDSWVRARVRVDTVLRGSLPHQTFWVKTHVLNSAMCGLTWQPFLNKTFLNASSGLTSTSDIKLPYFPWGHWNAAYWFDGRYLVAPYFPGLRLDITDLYPDYPATGIVQLQRPKIPLRFNGKSYRPDGRIVPNGPESGRKSPIPLIR